MHTSKTKTVIYCRVSSKEQEETGYSLASQDKLLTDYAENKDFAVSKRFSMAESASKWQIRKTLNQMLSYTEQNNINTILCEKIDRLTRSLKDAAIVDDWVHAQEGREVHFVKENFILNRNTRAHDNLVWDMKVAIARFYTNNLSEEVKKGQMEKLSQGWLPTKPPVGYKTIGEKGHKIHVIDEDKAPLIRKMFELYATGNYSLKAILIKMDREGLRKPNDTRLVRSRIHELLSDPFYCGKMRWKGQVYKGNHDPLITNELFDAVQVKLARKTGSPLYRKHLPVFKAMMRCEECTGIITWEIQKGLWYGHCNHYRNCSQKTYVRQEAVEEQLFPYFDKVAPKSEAVLKILEKALKESHSDEVVYNDSKRDQLNRIITTADKRVAAAYRDKIDGKMPAEVCQKVIEDSTQEKEDAISSLQNLSASRTAYYEAGFAIHELALQAKNIYLSPRATTEDKRLLLSHVFANHVLTGGKVIPNYTLAFQFLSEWIPIANRVASTQSALKGFSSKSAMLMTPNNHAMESSKVRNDFRTLKEPPVKPRHGQRTPISRPLLRGQDSN